MASTVKILRTNVTGSAPSSLVDGQIAINQNDGVLFYRNSGGAVTGVPLKSSTGGGNNLIPNGGFEAGRTNWTINTSIAAIVDDADAGEGRKYVAQTTKSGGLSAVSDHIPITGGDVYALNFMCRTDVATPNGIHLRILWFKADLTAASAAYVDAYSNGAGTTAWARRGGRVAAPANAKFARVQTFHTTASAAATLYFDDIQLSHALHSWDVDDSIALPGNPTAATQPAGDNSTRLSTTAFVTAAVATALTAKADLATTVPSLRALGGNGNGSADNTAIVNAAAATGKAHYVEEGTYVTSIPYTSMNGSFFGKGQIRDGGGNKRAPIHNSITAPPARGDYNEPLLAFNGDVSKVALCIEHKISGSTTLGNPSTAYMYTPEASAEYSTIYNNGAGHNQALHTNDGRTMLAGKYQHLYHFGQGDLYGHIVNGVVMGAKAGSTHFLANPAIGFCGGGYFAGSDGVMLNVGEIHLEDNGFDVSGIGLHTVMRRNNATGAKGTVWLGHLISSIGSAASDVGLEVKGRFKIGLDLSGMIASGPKAAIMIPRDVAIFLDSAQPAAGSIPAGWIGNSPGPVSIQYGSVANAIAFTVNNTPYFQISGGSGGGAANILSNNAPFNSVGSYVGFQVNNNQVVGPRLGGWSLMTGSAYRAAFHTDTATLRDVAMRLKAVIDDLHSHGLIGA